MASEWKQTQCALCPMSCGLLMKVEDGKIVDVKPDPDSPRSHGYACRKGRSSKYFVDSADRLEYPMKRVGDEFVRISWDQAYQEIAEKANKILDEHGPRAFSIIGAGTAAVQTPAATLLSLLDAVKGQYVFNALGVEFMGSWWTNGRIFGDQTRMVEPDDKETEVMIYWGSNSYVSHQIIDAREICREFSENPDKMVIVVDPRTSETARMADMHIMPNLSTDCLFLRALITYILEQGWENKAFIKKYVKDWDKTKKWFEGYDIDAALDVCGIPKEQMVELARILTTKKWGMHQDLGIYFNRHSTAGSFLCAILEIICGMLFVPGGNVPMEIPIPKGVASDERKKGAWRTPVQGRFPVMGEFPPGCIPDEVLGDNEDRIRMALTILCNPARSFPGAKEMEQALDRLELLVMMDHVWTEGMKYADYVLPITNSYEGDGEWNMFMLNFPEVVLHFRRRVVEPRGEAKEGNEVIAHITQEMGLLPKIPKFLYDAADEAARTGNRMKYFAKLVAWTAAGHLQYFNQLATVIALTLGEAIGSADLAMCWAGFMTGPLFMDNVIDVKADTKAHPILARFPIFHAYSKMDAAFQMAIDHPEGAVIGHVRREKMLKKYIRYRDGKFRTWAPEMEEYILKNITPEKEKAELTLEDGFNMVLSAGRHSDDGVNNTMRNPDTYKYRRPYALAMNPEDIKRFGFHEGQEVRVTTKGGSLTIPIESTWQTSVGYCLIPHHFGLKSGGVKVGESVNMITRSADIEPVTGNAIWRYTPCRVEALERS